METFLTFLELHSIGILLICLLVFALILLINWVAWIFSFGRFKGSLSKDNPQNGIFYLFADLIVKIINDFRHFLALILVLIFAISLGYAINFAKDIGELSSSVQAIMSTLGTLVGSIVGYYFGESAVKRAAKDKEDTRDTARPLIQEEPIREIVPPEGLKD